MIVPALDVEKRQTTTSTHNTGVQNFAEVMREASASAYDSPQGAQNGTEGSGAAVSDFSFPLPLPGPDPLPPLPPIIDPPNIIKPPNIHINYIHGSGYQVQEDLGPVSSLGRQFQTPKQVMRYFQEHPQKIFPFGLSGATKIKQGEKINLQIPLYGNAPVEVTNVTPTSFTFTTLPGHFDPPGSTITFSVHESGGHLYLEQTAHWKFAGGFKGLEQHAKAFATIPPAFAEWTREGSKLRKVAQG